MTWFRGHRYRIGLVWRVVWPVVLFYEVIIAFAFWADADWPEEADPALPPVPPAVLQAMRRGEYTPGTRPGWIDFVVICIIAGFFLLLANAMFRRMNWPDSLAVALIGAFLANAGLWYLVNAGSLWPYWFATHPDAFINARLVLRFGMVFWLGLGAVLLIAVTQKDRVRWRFVHDRLAPLAVAAAAALCVLAIIHR